MKNHKEIYREFVSKMISEHSPLKINDNVEIVMFRSDNRPYLISDVTIRQDGEFLYRLSSPRTDSTLPIEYTYDQLRKI